MNRLAVVVHIEDQHVTSWTIDRGPYYNDAKNERFLRAIARGLAAEGYDARLVRTIESRDELPL